MSNLVERARQFATLAHRGQTYGNDPYTVHLEDVASRVETEEQKVVAWLHDVIEDTQFSYSDLQQVFGFDVAQAVQLLSRPDNMIYFDFIRSIKDSGNDLAITVKIADNKSNIEAKGKPLLVERYKKSISILEGVANEN